jgi:hypothetical protein
MRNIFLLIFATAFVACNQKNPENFNAVKINFGDSIKSYVYPDSKAFVPYKKLIAVAAGLDSIYNGYDDMQIRIWLGHSLAIKHDIIILKFKNNKWSGERLAYTHVKITRHEATIKILSDELVTPKSGWESFFTKVEYLQVFKYLQEQTDTTHFYGGGGADGIDYTFELATKNQYHSLSYGNPEEGSSKNEMAKHILAFADLMEKEFNFKITR